MKISNCEMVKDLLPLYVDGVCSNESRSFVEEHLSVCEDCRQLERSIKDTTFDAAFEKETEGVLSRYAKKERTAAWKAGAVIAIILAVPVVIVAIVLSACRTNFTALPILISAMLLAASVTVVPLMSKKDKFARMILTATASIILIEFFVSLIEEFSFAKAAVPTIFGLSLPFFPFVLKTSIIPESFKRNKLVTVLTWDAVWFFLTLTVALFPYQSNASFREGTLFTFVLLILALISLVAGKVIKSDLNIPVKAGIVILSAGLVIAFVRETVKLYLNGMLNSVAGVFVLSNWTPSAIIATMVLTLFGFIIICASILSLVVIIKEMIEE